MRKVFERVRAYVQARPEPDTIYQHMADKFRDMPENAIQSSHNRSVGVFPAVRLDESVGEYPTIDVD